MKYPQNETMRLIGHQCIMPLFDRAEVVKQYREVFSAIEEVSPLMDEIECIDLFMLGYIWGKRDERTRKRRVL